MRVGRFDSRDFRAGRALVVLLSTAAIGGIVASAFLVRPTPRGGNVWLGRLADAVGAHRVTRARLTSRFTYAACEAAAPNDRLIAGLVCADARPSAWAQSGKLSTLATEMRSAGTADSTDAARRHAFGSWHIVWGDADAAIRELGAVARMNSTNASVRSDLAAAFLQRAQLEQDPLSILDAYAAIDGALALDPQLLEARFNRALALEWLYLRTDATQAWLDYLKLDARSAWADEARARLQALRTPLPSWSDAQGRLRRAVRAGNDTVVDEIVRRFPRRARDDVWRTITAWAHVHQDGASQPDTLLHRAMSVARSVESVTGDALPVDVVRPIELAAAVGDRSRLDALARGLVAYENGHGFANAFAPDSAAVWLGIARKAFAASGSPGVYLVAYDSAMIPYSRAGTRGYDEALSLFQAIRETTPVKYRVTRGRAARTVGLIHAIRADYDSSITAYQAAVVEGRGTGEPGLDLRPRGILASLYAEIRGEDQAWAELYAALRSLRDYPEELGEAQRLFVTAADLSRRRSPAAALLFQAEAVRLARLVDRSGTMAVTALAKQAELFSDNGMAEKAFESVHNARAVADSIVSDSTRALMIADVDLVEGKVWIHVSPESAVVVLRRAVERYRNTRYLLEMDRANLLLANAYVSSGQMKEARSAFSASLEETERRRAKIDDKENRAQFLDKARPVIDRVVAFDLEQADTVGALEFLEHMRARVLLDRVGRRLAVNARRPSRQPIADLQRTIPAGTSVISYAVLDSEVVSWVLHDDRVTMHRTHLTTSLEGLITRFTALIEARSSATEVRALSAQLYSVLIAPLRDDIAGDTRLIVIPDKWLHFLPFSALFDARAGRFLVESFEISVAPSIALYQQSAARYAQLGTATPSVLAVGNPSFDAATFRLPRLPGAELEAARVAQGYDHAQLMVGAEATKRAFLREAATSAVVHFAGHGVVNSNAPLLSYLLLAPEPNVGSSGALYVRDLFDIALPRTRLAILSGCHTAAGQLSETEGASSLARALFAAGVPVVIASLWAVDDTDAAEFFVSFHRELARGTDPGAALRSTQLSWLAKERAGRGALSTWAAFQLFGATSGSGRSR